MTNSFMLLTVYVCNFIGTEFWSDPIGPEGDSKPARTDSAHCCGQNANSTGSQNTLFEMHNNYVAIYYTACVDHFAR